MNMMGVIKGGIVIIIGIIMVIIDIAFLPDMFTETTKVLNDGNISNFIGAETTVKVLPTFAAIAIMLFTLLLFAVGGFMTGAPQAAYRAYRRKRS